MKRYFNFNRHELMTSEMRDAITCSLRPISLNSSEINGLEAIENMTYGLFDGYYYYELEKAIKILQSDMNDGHIEFNQSLWMAFSTILFVLSIVKTWENESIAENEVHAINLS